MVFKDLINLDTLSSNFFLIYKNLMKDQNLKKNTKNELIILGIPSLRNDLKFINKLNPKRIFVSDGISFTLLLNKTNKKVSDLLYKKLKHNGSLYSESIFLNDRENVENLFNKISYKKNSLANIIEYFVSWNILEFLRFKEFVNHLNNHEITLITTKEYFKLLKNIVDTKIFRRIIIRDINLFDFFIYFKKSSLISHYGRINFLRYAIGFTLLSIAKSRKHKDETSSILVSENQYSLNAAKFLFPKSKFESLDKYWKVSLPFFLKNYFKAYKANAQQLKKNKGLQKILRITPFLSQSVRYLYGPYLYCIELKFKELISDKKISTIVQHTDASPHRRLIVFEAKKNNIQTIVSDHGYLAEPIMITDIKSEILCTSSEGYIKYSNFNTFSSHQKTINISAQKKNTFIANPNFKKKNNFIYILTNGYSGYNLRSSLQDNFELIKKVLSKAHKFNAQNNLIIKTHPSESKQLYKDQFKDIKVINSSLDKISSEIERVIISTTSALFYLNPNCKVHYSNFGQRTYQFPKKNRFSIEEIIKDSLR